MILEIVISSLQVGDVILSAMNKKPVGRVHSIERLLNCAYYRITYGGVHSPDELVDEETTTVDYPCTMGLTVKREARLV